MTEIYVLSLRSIRNRPAYGCLIEFEDVLAHCIDAELITPETRERRGPRLLKRFESFVTRVPQPKNRDASQVLIVVGLGLRDVKEAIASVKNVRKRFDHTCAYVFDGFVPEEASGGGPRSAFRSRTPRQFGLLDRVFTPVKAAGEELSTFLETPVTFVPLATDVLKFGSGSASRPIDVIGYGRQNRKHTNPLAERFNDPGSSRIFYFTNHTQIGTVQNFKHHRDLFWKILTRSKVALCYDPMSTTQKRTFRHSFVGQRWFECLAGGCMILGSRPVCDEAADLLFWEDATIELPEDAGDALSLIEDLLESPDRLDAAHKRNYTMSLARHDWAHRIRDMLDELGIEAHVNLSKRLETLERAAKTEGRPDA